MGNPTTIYVVANRGVNTRIGGLASFQAPDLDLVYVTHTPVRIEPARNLVVSPRINPLGILRKLRLLRLKAFLDSIAYFPTRDMLYATSVVQTLRGLIDRDLACRRNVIVVSVAPPHALAIAGFELKKRYPDIRWVIDWQDLWSYDESYFNRIFVGYRRRARRLEREMIEACDMNITTNDFAKAALLALSPEAGVKATSINHHFDRKYWDPAYVATCRLDRASTEPIRLVYMGGMFKPPKVPGGKILETLRKVRSVSSRPVELHLYGPQSPEFEAYRQRESEYGLHYHVGVPRAQVVEELRKYDLLLLVLESLPNSELIMHLKLPEYLVAGPPILAVVPRGSAVADIIRRTKTGYIVAAESDWVDEIRCVIDSGLGGLCRNNEAIKQFGWASVREDWRSALGLPATQTSQPAS